MSQIVILTAECQDDDCDGIATSGVDFLGHKLGDPLQIDIDLVISQITLTCDECGKQLFIGDIEFFSEDEL